jgi:UDPglucose 6-dehydrogenase
MKIAVIGTGYVGLVAGACLAETGNDVVGADIDERKIDRLKRGEVPIYEPGLEPLIASNLEAGRLSFTTDVPAAVRGSDVIFIAVGTPPGEDGSADLKHVLAVAHTIGESMNGEKIVITKSTVPVGTAKLVREAIQSKTKHKVHVCSNPEFLKEGAAVDDFMKPDRVVLGVDSEYAAEVLRDLYAPFVRTGHSVLIMDVPSAEITKYAANSMLATRISFMNAIARLCDVTEANVDAVRKGVGSDSRIGPSFLFPGIGYGGSCLPGDETVLVRDENGTRLMRFEALFNERRPVPASLPGDVEPESVWADDLEVLSWSEVGGTQWRAVRLLTRRWVEEEVVEVRTKLGRRMRCTADHPFVVADGEGGAPVAKLARELGTSDWLPLAFDQPMSTGTSPREMDIVGTLRPLHIPDEDVIVRLGDEARDALDREEVKAAVEDHPRGIRRAQDIMRAGALRLNELRRLDIDASSGAIGTVRNGTYMPTAIHADIAFWRIVGLYLAEGHCGRDGRRMRLQWSFHPTAEPELVAEVAQYWHSRGVRADVRQRQTTCSVTVSSSILAKWWLDHLGLGKDCYTHRLPDAIWERTPEEQMALLSGLWLGDGSWSYVNGGPSVVLEWGTVSRELADGVLRLLGLHGIACRMKVGRASKSTVDTYWVVISGADQVERLLDFVKPADRPAVAASLARQSKRIAPTGHRQYAGAAWVRVVEKTSQPFRGWVYSMEVPSTETFVTTAGLVVHNCFPKDVKALAKTMKNLGVDASILDAVESVNEMQKKTLLERLANRLGGDLSGKRIAVWGLAFKPNTDDMREAPSLVTIEGLLARGAEVIAHDPVAEEEAARHLGDRVAYAPTNYEALEGAHALLIHTEWLPYRNPDFERMKAAMAEPLIFDGRNLYDPADVARAGFEYHSIGRPTAAPKAAQPA